MVPEVNLGYRYRFGKRVSEFNAAFIGDNACDLEVGSGAQKRGSFTAGLILSFGRLLRLCAYAAPQ